MFNPPNGPNEGERESSSLTEPEDRWLDDPEELETRHGPRVDVPEAPDPSETDATLDPAVKLLFWKLVVTFNVALLALGLGPMLVFFDGQWSRGGAVFVLGAVTFGYGLYEYWKYRRGKVGEASE